MYIHPRCGAFMQMDDSGVGSYHEHYLDLHADEESRGRSVKQSCFVTSAELFERLRGEPSLNEPIAEVYVYTEPRDSCCLFTILARNHYFVVLEARTWWWSFELRDDLLVIQRGRNFTNVQSRCQGQYRRYRLLHNGPSLEYHSSCDGRRRVSDVIFSLHKKGYFGGDVAAGDSPSLTFAGCIWSLCAVHQGG